MPKSGQALDALWTLLGFWVLLALCLLVILIGLNSLPTYTLAAPMSAALPTVLPPRTAIPIQTGAVAILPLSPTSPALPHPDLEPPAALAFIGQGALDQGMAQRLYEVSLTYLASTEREANTIARKLGFAGPGSHASNMCGPLAVALLRDAGLIEVYVDLHDFWLLQMDKHPSVVYEVFPPAKFDYYHFDTPLNEFDFATFPLFPGDFLYLYAGPKGTFNHMLTVTRVDAAGRAYTVTNLNGPDGYTIQEAMLYDPAEPGVGLFYDYTDRQKNRYYGLTGYGGFDLIRRKVPPILPSEEEQAFIDQVNTLIDRSGGNWRVLVREIGNRDIYSRHADRPAQIVSIIHVPIAMLFFKSLESIGIPPEEYREYIVKYGHNGRTYDQLLRAALQYSEREAAHSLLQISEYNGLRVGKVLADWGLASTLLSTQRATPRDIARWYEMLYTDAVLPLEANQLILEYLAEYPTNKATRLESLRGLLPEGAQFFYKRGSVLQNALILGDSALVTWESKGEKRAYVLVVIAYDSPLNPTTYERLEAAFADFAGLFWEYIGNVSP